MTLTPMKKPNLPEPWLRGTLTDVPPIQRAVLHALEMAKEDLERWCGELTVQGFNASPAGIAPVAFHIRHIARSMDRLLTYAEGKSLTTEQIAAMKSEADPDASVDEVFAELSEASQSAAARIRAFAVEDLAQSRAIGRQQMPTTLGGLLVHIADHTQLHVGQAITTAKVLKK